MFMFVLNLKNEQYINSFNQLDANILHMYINNIIQNKFLLKHTYL
jgi:hypothetical protein